jgi:hypothetical protein
MQMSLCIVRVSKNDFLKGSRGRGLSCLSNGASEPRLGRVSRDCADFPTRFKSLAPPRFISISSLGGVGGGVGGNVVVGS